MLNPPYLAKVISEVMRGYPFKAQLQLVSIQDDSAPIQNAFVFAMAGAYPHGRDVMFTRGVFQATSPLAALCFSLKTMVEAPEMLPRALTVVRYLYIPSNLE